MRRCICTHLQSQHTDGWCTETCECSGYKPGPSSGQLVRRLLNDRIDSRMQQIREGYKEAGVDLIERADELTELRVEVNKLLTDLGEELV